MKTKKKLPPSITLSCIFILFLVFISGIGMGGLVTADQNGPSIQSAKTLANLSGSLAVSPTVNVANDGAAISVVQTSTIATSNVTLGPSPNPIGTNISIDVRIDNVSVGFWGWSVATVTWNPTVMNLTQVQKGPFLSDNIGGDPTLFVGNSNKNWLNWNGTLSGGLSEGIVGPDTSIDASGVLATLTFLVTGSGNCTIGIAVGNLRLNLNDQTGINVACNNATITVLSNDPSSTPTPTPIATPSPTFTPTPSPTPTSTSTTTNNPTPTPTSSQSASHPPTATPTTPASIPEFPSWLIPIIIILILTSLAYLKKEKKSLRRLPT